MANPAVFVQHLPNFGRLSFVEVGQTVRIGGEEMVADGVPVTRAYEGAENLPAIEAWCSKQIATKTVPFSAKCTLLAPGIYSVEQRPATGLAALQGETPKAKGNKAA